MNKQKFFKLTKSFFVLTFFIVVCIFLKAEAEEGVPEKGLQISPTKVELKLKPGEQKVITINVKNYNKNIAHDIKVEIEDFFVKDDGTSNLHFSNKGVKHEMKVYDVANWIKVEEGFTLGPSEVKNVEVKVSVPEDIPTGGYYGALVFKTSVSNNDNQENNTAQLKEYYGARVLLFNAVYGNESAKFEGELLEFFPEHKVFLGLPISKNFSLKENLFKWGGNANLVTHVKNKGNLHYKVKGQIDVYKFRSLYKTIDIPEQMIYPDRIRIYNNQINYKWWDFGVYRAEVKLDSIDHDIHLEGKTGSWFIFPWKTFLILIIFILVNYIGRKNKRKKN